LWRNNSSRSTAVDDDDDDDEPTTTRKESDRGRYLEENFRLARPSSKRRIIEVEV